MPSEDAPAPAIRIWTPDREEAAPGAAGGATDRGGDRGAGSEADRLAAGVEALLFSSGVPVSLPRLAAALEVEPAEIRQAIRRLERRQDRDASGLRLARIAGGFQLTTAPAFRGAIERLLSPKGDRRLSEAALETLSVIAYRQPITVPELNALRGVRSQGVVATLLKRRLIRIRGRKRVVGRPLLYGTAPAFLDRFGLSGLDDLPALSEVEDPDAAAQVIPGLEAAASGGSERDAAPEPGEDP